MPSVEQQVLPTNRAATNSVSVENEQVVNQNSVLHTGSNAASPIPLGFISIFAENQHLSMSWEHGIHISNCGEWCTRKEVNFYQLHFLRSQSDGFDDIIVIN